VLTLGTMDDNETISGEKLCELELELNAANERLKQLEAKVDELHDLEKWLEGR
jgi:hypothetical protein